MKEPFFSIIIPTFNRADFIRETIESVQKQSFMSWECLVVDDGSIDNTAEIVSQIIIKDDRVRYIYQENAERSVARNNGINNSNGKYICFLDSDDYYKDNHLSVLYEEIKKTNEDIALYFVNHFVYSDNESIVSSLKYDNSPNYFIQNSTIPVRICIHSTILNDLKFDSEIVIVEDTVLWTQISLKFPVHHIEKETVCYRWHDDNSVNIKNNCFLPRLLGLKKLFSDLNVRSLINSRMRNIAISNCYYGIAKHNLYKRNFLYMLINISKSIILDIKCKQNKAKIYLIYEYFR